MSHCIGRVQKWWQKGNQPNMREITSAQDLQESLLKAGDKLVVVDFFLPGPWLSRLQSFPSEGSTEVPMVVYATSAAMLPLSRNLEMRWPSTIQKSLVLDQQKGCRNLSSHRFSCEQRYLFQLCNKANQRLNHHLRRRLKSQSVIGPLCHVYFA